MNDVRPLADRAAILLPLLVSLMVTSLLSGCASSPSVGTSVTPTDAGRSSVLTRWRGKDQPTPWLLPADAYPSQRLYRMRYQGPENKVSFRLTLYLVAEGHYRMEAADTLGRKAWSLGVTPGERNIFLDHRNKQYCASRGDGGQSFVPLAHLPLSALPQLVLGYIPATPSGEVVYGEGKMVFTDTDGHRWNAQEPPSGEVELSASEGLAWWSLEIEGEAVAWWRRIDNESIFSDRRGGQQVRWQEQVREPYDGELQLLDIPSNYREGVCGTAS